MLLYFDANYNLQQCWMHWSFKLQNLWQCLLCWPLSCPLIIATTTTVSTVYFAFTEFNQLAELKDPIKINIEKRMFLFSSNIRVNVRTFTASFLPNRSEGEYEI